MEPAPEPSGQLLADSGGMLPGGPLVAVSEDEEDHALAHLADGPDPMNPVDHLLAFTNDHRNKEARPMDFVRAKFKELKKENKALRERVQDLEQTLSIVQTAQEWTMGKGMTQEQAAKMQEIKTLLEQGKQARQDVQNFSSVGKTAMYEQLRKAKLALKKEREEKREMKERLMHAFDHARVIKDQHERLQQHQQEDRDAFEKQIRHLEDKHRRHIHMLQSASTAFDQEALMSSMRGDVRFSSGSAGMGTGSGGVTASS